VAYYTGEGLTENPDYAVKLFKQAAHLGHAGAAYMLGECLLDGIGAQRDRASALEWLVTAAELGHGLARDRVLVLLNEDYEKIENPSEDGPCEETSEAEKWAAEQAGDGSMSNIERRFTLGAASGEVGRRKSKVLDSRRAE
jgi:TPR repeat protein